VLNLVERPPVSASTGTPVAAHILHGILVHDAVAPQENSLDLRLDQLAVLLVRLVEEFDLLLDLPFEADQSLVQLRFDLFQLSLNTILSDD
jgi:hypothetical protein